MPTIQDYAQLAGRVYANGPTNRTPVPFGWEELPEEIKEGEID